MAQRGAGASAELHAALEQLQAASPGEATGGYLAFTQAIEHAEVPDVLLDPETAMASLHVELVQGTDEPWATLMILVAYR